MQEIDTIQRRILGKSVRFWLKLLIVLMVLGLLLVGGYYVIKRTTYSQVEIVKTYEDDKASEGNYIEYIDGVLEYSRDGVAMLTEKGQKLWNQPCQMSNPVAEVCKETALVGDKGGTSILVFQKNGLKGEIQTTRPIEKMTVSAQGIVGAILKDGETPRVMCYDAKGNVLVEQKGSLANTGYPVDVAISPDGNVLLVSYLGTKGTKVVSKVVFYHFGEAGENKEDHIVGEKEYENMIIPATTFINKDTSLLVGDSAVMIYQGTNAPKEVASVQLKKEVKSFVYDDEYIAFILKNSGKASYELKVYQTNGEDVFSAEFEGEYSDIKIVDQEVILYEENRCMIYNNIGVCKYKGTIDMNIEEIFPISGWNKYMVISANGFQEIQLAR